MDAPENIGNKLKRKIANLSSGVFSTAFSVLSVDNIIVLECESDMQDNPRTFFEYLLREKVNNSYKLIWIVKNPEYWRKKYPVNNVYFVSRQNSDIKGVMSLHYFLSKARWFIFSHPYWLKKWKKDQHVINTTHSVAQLKAPARVTERWEDYVLCCNSYCRGIKEQSFGNSVEYVKLGMPRLDVIGDTDIKDKKQYLANEDEKIVVAMCTFKQGINMKDSTFIDPYGLNVVNTQQQLNELNDFLKKNKTKLIIKIHHLQMTETIKMNNLENIVYLTDDDLMKYDLQVNDLLNMADCLLTDYSSVFYDYLLLDRPIGFFVNDISDYNRGFINSDPLSEMPGVKIHDYDQLIDFLSSYGTDDDYRKERSRIADKVFDHKDRNNCERLYNWMKTIDKNL